MTLLIGAAVGAMLGAAFAWTRVGRVAYDQGVREGREAGVTVGWANGYEVGWNVGKQAGRRQLEREWALARLAVEAKHRPIRDDPPADDADPRADFAALTSQLARRMGREAA